MEQHARCLYSAILVPDSSMWNAARVPTRYLHLGREKVLYVVSAEWVYVCG